MNPIITTVLDLDVALGGNAGLLLGGGLGLYLKQEHLRATNAKTFLPFDRMPPARTTQDIDLFLRAEVIANKEHIASYRAALDSIGFVVAADAKWLKFKRATDVGEVVLDIMVGPLGEHAGGVQADKTRVRPRELKAKDGLHARRTDDAVGVEHAPMSLTVRGRRSDGSGHECSVLVPWAFPYALMKLGALRDRINDAGKQEGRHHAMDLYRIVGMLTEQDQAISAELALASAGNPVVADALQTVEVLLASPRGLGRIRLLEYQRMNQPGMPEVDPELLVAELRRLLTPATEV